MRNNNDQLDAEDIARVIDAATYGMNTCQKSFKKAAMMQASTIADIIARRIKPNAVHREYIMNAATQMGWTPQPIMYSRLNQS